MRFNELPEGAKFRLTVQGRELVKRDDGFITPWGAQVPCKTPLCWVFVDLPANPRDHRAGNHDL